MDESVKDKLRKADEALFGVFDLEPGADPIDVEDAFLLTVDECDEEESKSRLRECYQRITGAKRQKRRGAAGSIAGSMLEGSSISGSILSGSILDGSVHGGPMPLVILD